MDAVTRILLGLGLLLLVAAGIWHFTGGKIPLFNLPGDLRFEVGKTKIFIPLTSALLLSGLYSLLAYIFRK